MKIYAPAACAVLVLLIAACQSTTPLPPSEAAQAEAAARAERVADEFLGDLKGELMMAMKEGGPVNAIDICSVRGQAAATEASARTGCTVRRVSARYRNPADAPNAATQRLLDWAEEEWNRAAQGQRQNLAYAMLSSDESGYSTNWIQPLGVSGICLQCHGEPEQLAEGVAERLATLYPEDRAVGYEEGDFRGILIVSVPH